MQVVSLQSSRVNTVKPTADATTGMEDQDAFWAKVVRERATLKATVEQLSKELMAFKKKKDTTEDQLKQIIGYMQTRPYAEVVQGIQMLATLTPYKDPEVPIEVTNKGKK